LGQVGELASQRQRLLPRRDHSRLRGSPIIKVRDRIETAVLRSDKLDRGEAVYHLRRLETAGFLRPDQERSRSMARKADDADLYKPPPGPKPSEVWAGWAREGDVESLLAVIRTKCWGFFSVEAVLKHVLDACQVRAKSDPEGFARLLLGEMAALNGFLLLRTHVLIIDRVVGRGPFACKPSLTDFSADVAERLLPRLMEMQRGLAEVFVAQAQTARLWGLARAKEAQAGRAARAERRRPHAPGGEDGREESAAAAAKAGGPRDGMAPPPARGRRRG
jgi:hypothetical protein